MDLFFYRKRRPRATVAGILSVALGLILLLCGAGSMPVKNLLPQGTMQGDLDAGGHNILNANNVVVILRDRCYGVWPISKNYVNQ